MAHWNAMATYDDGTIIDRDFPYTANGNYSKEIEEQYEIESWLLEEHEGCNSYSVSFVLYEDDEYDEDEEGIEW